MRDLLAEAAGLPVAFATSARRRVAEFDGRRPRRPDAVVVTIARHRRGPSSSTAASPRRAAAAPNSGTCATTPVDPTPASARRARSGCLETVASAQGVADACARATGSASARADPRACSAPAAAGDPVAQRVVDACIDALALAFAQLTAILSPEVVVVAGGLSRAGEQLLGPLASTSTPSSPSSAARSWWRRASAGRPG